MKPTDELKTKLVCAHAEFLGKNFAEYVNLRPLADHVWKPPLTADDSIPLNDLKQLERQYGPLTSEMLVAYKRGFNGYCEL